MYAQVVMNNNSSNSNSESNNDSLTIIIQLRQELDDVLWSLNSICQDIEIKDQIIYQQSECIQSLQQMIAIDIEPASALNINYGNPNITKMNDIVQTKSFENKSNVTNTFKYPSIASKSKSKSCSTWHTKQIGNHGKKLCSNSRLYKTELSTIAEES